jgi:hypothetical protein
MLRYRMAVGLLMAIAISPLCATVIAYTDAASQGNQGWGGNLGMDFTVNVPIAVTSLGVFNASGSGHITGFITVGILYEQRIANAGDTGCDIQWRLHTRGGGL